MGAFLILILQVSLKEVKSFAEGHPGGGTRFWGPDSDFKALAL